MPTTALTIGNFDAVHIGHAALVARARELVGPSGRVVALVFDPHPLTRLRPEAAPPRLSTFDQRSARLHALGADTIERLDPDCGVLSLSPEQFVANLVEKYTPAAIVEGEDFHFGKARAGNVRTLAALGRVHGFACDVVPPVEVALTDATIVRASSSIVRWLVAHARVRDAALVLGRPYEVEGVVIRGDRRGRLIGCPTANLHTEQLLPADGVYAGVATLPDGRTLPAAVNVGTRPTFDGVGRRLEAHLLHAPAKAECVEGLPEYGWRLRVEITRFVRDDLRFDSVEDLCAQMRRDLARCATTP